MYTVVVTRALPPKVAEGGALINDPDRHIPLTGVTDSDMERWREDRIITWGPTTGGSYSVNLPFEGIVGYSIVVT